MLNNNFTANPRWQRNVRAASRKANDNITRKRSRPPGLKADVDEQDFMRRRTTAVGMKHLMRYVNPVRPGADYPGGDPDAVPGHQLPPIYRMRLDREQAGGRGPTVSSPNLDLVEQHVGRQIE